MTDKHPRLQVTDFDVIKQKIENDPFAARMYARVKEAADKMLTEPVFSYPVEKLAPGALLEEKGGKKLICANVDLYSGLVYRALNISPDLFTPLFAVARMAGWCAHRIEELMTGGKIIRPAYKAISPRREYISINDR